VQLETPSPWITGFDQHASLLRAGLAAPWAFDRAIRNSKPIQHHDWQCPDLPAALRLRPDGQCHGGVGNACWPTKGPIRLGI